MTIVVRGHSMHPVVIDPGVTWTGGYFSAHSILGDSVIAPIYPPANATFESISCLVVDNVSANLTCELMQGATFTALATASSSGSSGFETAFATAPGSPPVDPESSYWVRVRDAEGNWSDSSFGLAIWRITVKMTVNGPR